MAQAVRRFSEMGYTWMKYHLSPFENVLDQMEAMQAVAPEGFRIHHDITMHGTNDHMFELLEKISKYPHRRLLRGSTGKTRHRGPRRTAQTLPLAHRLSPRPAGI